MPNHDAQSAFPPSICIRTQCLRTFSSDRAALRRIPFPGLDQNILQSVEWFCFYFFFFLHSNKTYLARSALSQETEQIATLHQFHDNVECVCVKANANQTENVFVFKIAHQLCLLQEFPLFLFGGTLSKCFDGHSGFQFTSNIHNKALVHLTECATAKEIRNSDLIASNLWQQSNVAICDGTKAVQDVVALHKCSVAW